MTTNHLPVLDYLECQLNGQLTGDESIPMRYPTAVSQLLGFRITAIGAGKASLTFNADANIHGNQQGTVHGGMLAELADATIGTAHSTLMQEGESFTSIDLRINFLRPVWQAKLTARAWATHQGRTISHYQCDIVNEDGKTVAVAHSVVMTLRGDKASGR